MTIANIGTFILLTAAVVLMSACGGSDKDDGQDTVCPAVYQPVCGLVGPQPPLRYETFSNSCYATAAGAELISFEGECGELEGSLTQAASAVIIHAEQADLPDSAADVVVQNADFDEHDLNLTLRHSGGCGDHSFELHTALPFMESHPLQINASLTHETDDSCEALITSEVTVDLRPLAEIYRQQYQQSTGEIYVGDLGLYQF